MDYSKLQQDYKRSTKGLSYPKDSLISVIVPVFNVEQYLPECLDSIIFQSYKNLEIICINDGSTDGSEKILQSYADKDNRIKIISKPNGGVSQSRNRGIEVAQGAYISFVDSDDVLLPDFYEKLIDGIKDGDNDVIQSGTIFWHKQNQTVKGNLSANISDFGKILAHLKKCYVWNKLWRKSFLDKNELRFDEHIGYCEDVLFTIKAAFYAKSWKFINYAGYLYRYNEQSASHSSTKEAKRRLDRYEVIKQSLRFAAENDFTFEKIKALEDFLIGQTVDYNDILDENYRVKLLSVFNNKELINKRYSRAVSKKRFSFSLKKRELIMFGKNLMSLWKSSK